MALIALRHCPRKRAIQYFRASVMSRERTFWVYILASRIGGTLYIGVTNDLVRRVYEHRTDAVPGFTKKYQVHRLVHYNNFRMPKTQSPAKSG
jgi:predicted GIY-YIG superfamily endonuclease